MSSHAPTGLRSSRIVRAVALAGVVSFSAVPAASVPAQADPPPSPYFYWKWGGQGPAICKLSAYLDSSSRYVDGKRVVRARGYFHGCDDGRTMSSGDGDLTVTGTNTAGKKFGGSTGWCPKSCSKTVYIRWSGKGTYKLRVSYGDTGYLIRFGTDPQKRISKKVTS